MMVALKGKGAGGERGLQRSWGFGPREEAELTGDSVSGRLGRAAEEGTAWEADPSPGDGPKQLDEKSAATRAFPT